MRKISWLRVDQSFSDSHIHVEVRCTYDRRNGQSFNQHCEAKACCSAFPSFVFGNMGTPDRAILLKEHATDSLWHKSLDVKAKPTDYHHQYSVSLHTDIKHKTISAVSCIAMVHTRLVSTLIFHWIEHRDKMHVRTSLPAVPGEEATGCIASKHTYTFLSIL